MFHKTQSMTARGIASRDGFHYNTARSAPGQIEALREPGNFIALAAPPARILMEPFGRAPDDLGCDRKI